MAAYAVPHTPASAGVRTLLSPKRPSQLPLEPMNCHTHWITNTLAGTPSLQGPAPTPQQPPLQHMSQCRASSSRTAQLALKYTPYVGACCHGLCGGASQGRRRGPLPTATSLPSCGSPIFTCLVQGQWTLCGSPPHQTLLLLHTTARYGDARGAGVTGCGCV
jgi:hypothetical protein